MLDAACDPHAGVHPVPRPVVGFLVEQGDFVAHYAEIAKK